MVGSEVGGVLGCLACSVCLLQGGDLLPNHRRKRCLAMMKLIFVRIRHSESMHVPPKGLMVQVGDKIDDKISCLQFVHR